MKQLELHIKEAIENNGFTVYEYTDGAVELETYISTGESRFIYISNAENILDELQNRINKETNCEMYILCRALQVIIQGAERKHKVIRQIYENGEIEESEVITS